MDKTLLGLFMGGYIDALSQTALFTNGEGDDVAEDDNQVYTDCVDFLARSNIQHDLAEAAGYDFLHTRQGHYSAFWDRREEYGPNRAEMLTKLAESYGDYNV
jgi:hypothetical protein